MNVTSQEWRESLFGATDGLEQKELKWPNSPHYKMNNAKKFSSVCDGVHNNPKDEYQLTSDLYTTTQITTHTSDMPEPVLMEELSERNQVITRHNKSWRTLDCRLQATPSIRRKKTK